MNIFNSLLAQLVKYDVHTTRKINLIHAIFYHILSFYWITSQKRQITVSRQYWSPTYHSWKTDNARSVGHDIDSSLTLRRAFSLTCLWTMWTYFNETYHNYSFINWRDTFCGKHEHGDMWLLICVTLEKHVLTCLSGPHDSDDIFKVYGHFPKMDFSDGGILSDGSPLKTI